MSKILWVTNVVLPDYCFEYGIKHTYSGGWITGLLNSLQSEEIALCFPIRDREKVKNGKAYGHDYYSLFVGKGNEPFEKIVENAKRIIQESQPDIVHIWGTEFIHSAAFSIACSNLNKKSIIDIQGIQGCLIYHMHDGIPDYWLRKKNVGESSLLEYRKNSVVDARREELTVNKAYYVLGRTNWDRKYVEQMKPNVRYMACQRVLRKQFYENKKQWNLNTCDQYRIFMSQGTSTHKGVHYMLEALPYILKRYPNTIVRIGGISPIDVNIRGNIPSYGLYLRHLISKLGLEEHVAFVGRLNEEEMINEYLNANIFVSASSVENNSNSICEAQFLGTPVISSFVGGLGDIIQDGETGIFYSPGDVRMLAGCVCDTFANPEKQEYMSENGKSVARQRHDRDKIAATMQEIYREVANGN